MRGFFSRLVAWTRRGKFIWLVVLPGMVTVFYTICSRNQTWGLTWFKIIGIAMEALGLWTVVRSLSRESRQHGQTGYRRFCLEWLLSAKEIIFPRPFVLAAASAGSSSAICEAGLCEAEVVPADLPGKVDYLLKKVRKLQEAVDQNRNSVNTLGNRLTSEVSGLKNELSSHVLNIHTQFKEKATQDYYFLISGSLLTLQGMLMTNLPDEVLRPLFS